jgi:ketosteroid isomerase-like protein
VDDEAIIKAAYDAWNRGDVEALVALTDPAIEWHGSGAFPGLGTLYRGHDGMRELFENLTGPFSSFFVHVEEIRRDRDHFEVQIRMEGVGATSGAPVQVPFVNQIVVEGGLVRTVRTRLKD